MAGLVGKKLDHYRLLDQIGVGGMATVYRAVDERQAQKVAIKVLSPTISSDRRFVRRFRREGGLVSRLKHNSIVPVIDYGEFDGLVYLVSMVRLNSIFRGSAFHLPISISSAGGRCRIAC